LHLEPFKKEQHSDSVTGLLRLDKEGSSIFLQAKDRSGFVRNLIQEFSTMIPINGARLSSNERSQPDPDSPDNLFLSFKINEAKDDANEPSSSTIYENLRAMIENRGYTAVSNDNYTSLVDKIRITREYYRYHSNFYVLLARILIYPFFFFDRELFRKILSLNYIIRGMFCDINDIIFSGA
jgi:hypothetical protein